MKHDAYRERLAEIFDLYDALLPKGGYVVSYRAYFDESYSDGLFCIAGYIVEKRSAKAMQRPWDSMLSRYRVPYFHMVEVAQNTGVVLKAELNKHERIALASEAISLTRKHITYGIATIVSENGVREHMMPVMGIDAPYIFCTRTNIHRVGIWAHEHNFGGKLAFYFEQGHRHAGRAAELMDRLSRDAEFREFSDIGGYSFAPKASAAPLQAADLLAWHTVKHIKRQREGKPVRNDFKALLENRENYGFIHWDDERLAELAAGWRAMGATPADWYGAAVAAGREGQ